MALFTPGPAVSEVRGSSGGTVFSRNRFGAYLRGRTVPINPNTSRQVAARDRFNTLATAWRDVLTQGERDAWDTYAAETNWINVLGQVVNLTGLNHFVRSNNFRLIAAKAPLTAAPVIFGLPAQEDGWSHAVDSVAQQITVTYTFAADVDDQDYFFYQGTPIDASRVFFAGPWRLAATVFSDSVTPPASPKVSASPYVVGAGQAAFCYCRRLDADGRLSEPFRQTCIVT